MNLALGLIETKGLVGALEAADAMAKAASVKIVGKEKVTSGLILIKIEGEVAAVKSAVDAGSVAAQRVGQLVSAHVIPRPAEQIDTILVHNKKEPKAIKKEVVSESIVSNKETTIKKTVSKFVPKEKSTTKNKTQIKTKTIRKAKVKNSLDIKVSSKLPPFSELELLNVHSLRKLARSYDEFPIKGREISKANRGKLLDYFKKV